MRGEPGDLDLDELRRALAARWGLRDARLDYRPVGFGSHHWLATGADGTVRWASVDDLEAGFQAGPDADGSFAALERAFLTAAELRDRAGLEFVLAPLRDRDGAVLHRLGGRYALRAAPFVEGGTSAFGPYETVEERRAVARLIGRLHAATPEVAPRLPRLETFEIPSREGLDAALADLARPWRSGPFAEPARRLLRAHAGTLARRLHAYDELRARVAARSGRRVVTHGEPHRANVLRDPAGGLHLLDWDTVLLAPPERDLWMVLDEELAGWDAYRELTGADPPDPDTLRLYHEWWDLADVSVYVALFRRPHVADANTEAVAAGLAGSLGS